MGRISASTTWLLVGVCLLGGLAASIGTAETRPFASTESLDHSVLGVAWEVTLPLLDRESLDTMLVLEDRLYVRSSRNYVWSIERSTGKIVFARSIAPHGSLVLGWTPYEDRLITVVDNQIVELDKNTGIPRRTSDPEVGIVAPIARNSRFFYIAGSDRRLHALRTLDMTHVFDAAVAQEPLMNSVFADEETVVVGTDGVNLVAIAADTPKKLWQLDAGGAIAGPVVRDGESFYFASKDTNVYRVDRVGPMQADCAWRYQTEAILDREPRVTSGAVYQYALYRGLSAIDKRRGTALWVLPEGIDLLAEADNRAYVLSKNKTLAVMDNTTTKCLCWVDFSAVTKHATNTLDGKICVADDGGRMVCLQPVP